MPRFQRVIVARRALACCLPLVALLIGGTGAWAEEATAGATECSEPAKRTTLASDRGTNSTELHAERFASIAAFVRLFGEAEGAKLYVGVPRPTGYEGERDKLPGVIEMQGFQFLPKPHAVSGASLRKLHSRFARVDSFAPYAGPKFCGRFHPNCLLEWTSGSTRYQALFCFGCSEIRWFGADDYEVWCDMSETGDDLIQKALAELTGQEIADK